MKTEVIHGDALEVLRGMADNSVDAVVTDPPYFKVKGEAWDHQWDKPHQFIEWMGQLSEQWQRVLKPNGSLYVFASPKMAARVEVKLMERFEVLNHIVWSKYQNANGIGGVKGRHEAQILDKGIARSFFPDTERIIFAEHYGADNIAKGEAGYAAKCDELRGFVFEPLRAYLAGEVERAGLTAKDANEATRTQMAGHWFTRVQWALPTAKHYATLRERANATGGDYLRREYEDLRREYEDLRRPFTVTADDQYTDVWTFPTVQAYQGKHVCEKPLALMEHIIRSSTRPGAVVLDCFSGSAATGHACVNLGRSFIGIELDPKWVETGRRRLEIARQGVRHVQASAQPETKDEAQLDLFA